MVVIQSDLQFVHLSEEIETLYHCRYSKDVRRTEWQALTIATIARFTHSPYTTDS